MMLHIIFGQVIFNALFVAWMTPQAIRRYRAEKEHNHV